MSAPEVGDRVRVIAGQWTGWEGLVTGAPVGPRGEHGLHLLLTNPATGRKWPRFKYAAEVEKVPTTPTDGHRGDETGADVLP